MICKRCGQNKQKLKAEPRNNGGHYYRDERGRMWQGHICPDCFWPTNKSYYKEDKDEHEMHPDRDFNPDPMTLRKCRKCNWFLPESRYFFHEECSPKNVRSEMEGW